MVQIADLDERSPIVDDTARQRSARRSRIIAEVWRDFVDENVAAGTIQECLVGEMGTEEGPELAALSAEASAEVHRRTNEALQAGAFLTVRRPGRAV
jgi:hypothetical protein